MRSLNLTICIAAVAMLLDAAAAPAQPPAAPAKPPALPVATLAQFDQAMEVAVLAAEHDLHELSLRAVRDALRPGPPALPMKAIQRNAVRVVRSSPSNKPDGDQSQIAGRVEQRLSRLNTLWKSRSAPPEAVYETLAAAVLPAGRPAEILLYAPPLTVSSLTSPTSAGKTLVEWTVRAGCAERLRKQVAERLPQPLAQLPGHVLLVQLALATGDRKAAAESLAWLTQRLEGETLQSSAEIACHAALPALNDAELAPQAVSIVERAAKNLSAQVNQSSNDEPAASLLLLLARHQLRQGAAEAGRKTLDDYLAVCQQMNLRYSGDYGIYRRKQQLAKVATELATAGLLDPALDILAQYADAHVESRSGQADFGTALAALLQQLAALPAAERYEKLKQWSLPAKDRKSVRLLAAFVPQDELPEAFRGVIVSHSTTKNQSENSTVGRPSRPSGAKDGLEGRPTGAPPRLNPGSRTASPSSSPGNNTFDNASGDLASTLALLVEAAQSAGQLDELAQIAHDAAHDADQKIENATALEVLVGLARRRPENVRDAATALAAELAASKPAQAWTLSGLPGVDYLVANACAADAALSDVGLGMLTTLLNHSQQSQNHPLLSHLRIDLAQQAARRLGQRRRDDVDQIIPWQPAVFMSAATHRAGAARPWWAVDGRQAVHAGGAETDHLIFNYPLTGTFEITADLLDGAWAEANLGFGGVCFAAYTHGKEAHIFPVGHHEQILRPLFGRHGDSFRHHTIQVAPGSIQFLVDGHLAYREADPGTAAPWLDFFTSRERRTAFRNVRITGQPVIPRQVELVKGDRLDGWLANFYNESQPARIYKGKPNDTSGGYYRFGSRSFYDYDWRAADSVIRGGRAPGLPAGSQSRLCYMRPLADGETLRYEFLYEPDATHVSPALDRLAFLIEPEGVALHWMTDGESDSPQLPPDNVAVEQDNRRGPKRLPLKPGEWNAMRLRLEKGEVALTLNGTEIYRRPLETTNDRLFSFFHFKERTAVEVRNVVLSGDDWPRELSEARLANLLAPIKHSEDVDPAGLAETLLGEENVFLTTWQVWQASRTLAAAERYSYLRDWVLPGGPGGSVVRLYGDFTPLNPAPPVDGSSDAPRRSGRSPKATDSPSSRRAGTGATLLPPTSSRSLLPAASQAPADGLEGRPAQSGGDLVVPALDLVAVAAEIGKLDELRLLAEARLASDEFTAEGKTALLALIALAESDDERAGQALQVLYPATKNVKKESPEYRRWPALMAAWAAFEQPVLRPIAMTMLNKLADGSQGSGASWERTVRHLRARASLAAMPDGNIAFGAPLPLKQWQAAAHGTAATRGGGHPRLHWQHRPGGLMHYPGHEFGYAYFAVPMGGNFEIEAELSTFGFREITAAYSASVFGLVYDRKNYTQWNFERKQPNGTIIPPLDDLGRWYRYRLAVKDGQATTFVNGRQIATYRLSDEPDPWFAFRSWELFSAEARQVRITGTPQIPDELHLSAAANLDAWLAEYYGETVSGENANWQKRGEEIFGRKIADAGEATWQSLLQYHRPLFEDGQIHYEFFYQPGEATVAPALDRLALLLEPSGVDVHWLTDAQYDRTNLPADNRTTENGNRRGPPKLPLKVGDWNQVRLTLKGDNIRLQLNGTEVYQRDLEPTNQRVFGLYHDAAHTEARIRNVLYRGDWPKKLPPLAEQELAVSPASRAAFSAKPLSAKLEFDFRGNSPLPADLLTVPAGGQKYIRRTADGARIVLPVGQDKPTAVGYETAFRLHGDFELIASYSGLKTIPDPKSWGPGIDLHLHFDAPASSDAMLERRQRHDSGDFVQSTLAYDLRNKLDRITTNHFDPVATTTGKLKIARKGPMIYYLIAEHDSDDYRLLAEHLASEADAVRAQVYARSFSKDAAVDVVLESVSIRAEAFQQAASDKRP